MKYINNTPTDDIEGGWQVIPHIVHRNDMTPAAKILLISMLTSTEDTVTTLKRQQNYSHILRTMHGSALDVLLKWGFAKEVKAKPGKSATQKILYAFYDKPRKGVEIIRGKLVDTLIKDEDTEDEDVDCKHVGGKHVDCKHVDGKHVCSKPHYKEQLNKKNIALNAHDKDQVKSPNPSAAASGPEDFTPSDKNRARARTIQSPQNGENCDSDAHASVASRRLKTSSQENSTDNLEIDSKVIKNIIGDPEDYQEYPGYTVGQLDLKCYRDAQNAKMIRTLWEIYQHEKGDMVRAAGGDYKYCNPIIDGKTLSALIQKIKKVPGRTRKVCHILNALTFFIRAYGSDCFSDHFAKGASRRTTIRTNFPEAYKCIAGLNYAKELERKLPVLLKLLENDAFKQAALDTFPVYIKTQEEINTRMNDYIDKLPKPPEFNQSSKIDKGEIL